MSYTPGAVIILAVLLQWIWGPHSVVFPWLGGPCHVPGGMEPESGRFPHSTQNAGAA